MMKFCMTLEDRVEFLTVIEVPATVNGIILTIHSETPRIWIWTGDMFCAGGAPL